MYKLIMLPNPILVSDEEIKEGDWVVGINFPDKPIARVVDKYGDEFTAQSNDGTKHGLAQYESFKVIAGLPELPRLDLSAVNAGIVQDLAKPKAYNVEVEMEEYCGSPLTVDRCPKCVDSCDRAYSRPKITNNTIKVTKIL